MRLWLLPLLLPLLLGCSRQSHDPRFVGRYRGMMEARNILFEANTPERQRLEARILREMEEDWKSGRAGLELQIHEGGRFTLRFWMPGIEDEVFPIPGLDHTSEGRWWNKGDVLILRSDGYSPYFYNRVTRYRGRYSSREKREQELQLKLTDNGVLSNLDDLKFYKQAETREKGETTP